MEQRIKMAVNLDHCQAWQCWTFEYLSFNDVTGEPDTPETTPKKGTLCLIVGIVYLIDISNELLFYVGRSARYFFHQNELGLIRVSPSSTAKLLGSLMKKTGFSEVLWDTMFHVNISEAKKN
jgi:hypothetical protein